MIRFCPNCHTERALDEFFCEGTVNDLPCNWDLSGEAIHEQGWRPSVIVTSEEVKVSSSEENLINQVNRLCMNGHPVEEGDFICTVCGVDIEPNQIIEGTLTQAESEQTQTEIDGWRLINRLTNDDSFSERFLVQSMQSDQQAILILYHSGMEPEPAVYKALQQISSEHIPQIYITGRWENRFYEIVETFSGQTVADIKNVINDEQAFSQVVHELASALSVLSECGIRHRHLKPGSLLIRNESPLDLVISEFGSARLSEFDLTLVAPLETSIYMAPEAIIGVVSPASDWWSLGMILLALFADRQAFHQLHPQAFLVSMMTNGIQVPETCSPRISSLLKGLLTRDHHKRWQYPEVQKWLNGEYVAIAETSAPDLTVESLQTIQLGGKYYIHPQLFALQAAQQDHWSEALSLLQNGSIMTWLEGISFSDKTMEHLRYVMGYASLPDNWRLMIVLKLLNHHLPLILNGELVTPAWLLSNPQEAYKLIEGDVPDILFAVQLKQDAWLNTLKLRIAQVRDRAAHLEISLNEEALQIYLLNTSQARLSAIWTDRQKLFPEATIAGLSFLMARKYLSEIDLIVLLSAQIEQFRTIEEILQSAERFCQKEKIEDFSIEAARAYSKNNKVVLFQLLNDRLENFASCGIEKLDFLAQQFRLTKRLPLAQVYVLLSIPESLWVEPSEQQYYKDLLNFYQNRVMTTAMRGTLARMSVSERSTNVDITELGTMRRSSEEILNHIISRHERVIRLDPACFGQTNLLLNRLRRLTHKNELYQRDTGIDGLYMGFPFLVVQGNQQSARPRIMPLLLWPVKISMISARTTQVDLLFDNNREEVRLNPILRQVVGEEAFNQWQQATDELLGRSELSGQEVLDSLGHIPTEVQRDLQFLAPKDRKVSANQDLLIYAAVLFHSAFMGQALSEDLKEIKNRFAQTSSLSTLFSRQMFSDDFSLSDRSLELNRYFIVQSDPSQEVAIQKSAAAPGLVIEGPPGTGKSQTIVNLVANAVGNHRSVLIVCQKKAALEVVYKRLLAEGMENRVLMINDVNQDRTTVIRAVREQVEDYLRNRNPYTYDSCVYEREKVAALITQIENELDGQHNMLFTIDKRIGKSFREVLSELITMAQDKSFATLTAPQLRSFLRVLSVPDLASVEEHCAPIAHLWLPAQYEYNPLGILKNFTPDASNLASLKNEFLQLNQAEKQRCELLSTSKTDIVIQESETVKTWLNAYADKFNCLTEEEHIYLAQWLPLFKVVGENKTAQHGQVLLQQLQVMISRLSQCPLQMYAPVFSPKLIHQTDKDLNAYQKAIQYQLKPDSFIQKITTYFVRKRLFRFLTQCGFDHSLTPEHLIQLQNTIRLELQWRPLRKELKSLLQTLNLPVTQTDECLQLLPWANQTQSILVKISDLIQSILPLPEVKHLDYALLSMNKAQWQSCFEQYRIAYERRKNQISSQSILQRLAFWCEPEWLNQFEEVIIHNQYSHTLLEPVINCLEQIHTYMTFKNRINGLTEQDMRFFAILRIQEHELNKLSLDQLDQAVRFLIQHEARLAWKERFEQECPALLMDRQEIKAKITHLDDLDRQMRQLNNRLLKNQFDQDKIAKLGKWEDITRLTGRRTKRLREFVEQGEALGLMHLRPVWLLNPDVASRLLPLKAGLFDLVVYDEASQIPVEYAIPTLYRGKVVVISGDEKQMPPSYFFSAQMDAEEETDEDELIELSQENLEAQWHKQEIKDCTDLLQLGRRVLPRTTLQIHYRSVFRELINFSNMAFYQNQLQVPTYHTQAEINIHKPLEFIAVNGIYEDQTNMAEALRVISLLSHYWLESDRIRYSIGVITFNQKQAALVQDLIDQKNSSDDAFREQYLLENNRIEQGEDKSFFVKNVENVQGDERDIIIFSSTFGHDVNGRFIRNFGALGHKGGERRLNVAITRAKRKIILLNSMPITDISDMFATQRAPIIPRDYLQLYWAYIQAVSSAQFKQAEQVLSRVGGRAFQNESMLSVNNQINQVDGFCQIVGEYIRTLNWTPVRIDKNDIFNLDFMIENNGQFFIGIECDAPNKPLLKYARAREIWRPKVLKQVMPVIHRVSACAWYNQTEEEKRRLKQAINDAYKQLNKKVM